MADSQADSQAFPLAGVGGRLLERTPQVGLGPDSGTVGQALLKYLADSQAY